MFGVVAFRYPFPSELYTVFMSAQPIGKRPHFLIVGAGIAGCSLAYSLSSADFAVTVIEAGRVAEVGASSVPVALLNPNRGRTARASDLDRRGLRAMHALAQDLRGQGYDSGIHFTGVLRIAESEKQRKKWQGLAVKQLRPYEIPQPYNAPFGGIMIAEGGWLEPAKLLKVLQQVAQNRGAVFKEKLKVDAIVYKAEGVSVITAQGKMHADTIIVCTGATPNPNFDLPAFEPMAGDVIALDADVPMPYPLAGVLYGMKHKGLIHIGGNHRENLEAEPSDIARLQKSSSWFIGALADADIVNTWSGMRAKRPDNQPLIIQLNPNIWFFGALGGRGFLCSYYLAQEWLRNFQGLKRV